MAGYKSNYVALPEPHFGERGRIARLSFYAPHEGVIVVNQTAPVIGPFNPVSGSNVQDTTPILVDVTGVNTLVSVSIRIEWADGRIEVAYEGSAANNWTDAYNAGSARSDIANGWRFSVVRDNRWAGNFTLRVRAVDEFGNVTIASASYTRLTPGIPKLTVVSPAVPGPVAYNQVLTFKVTGVELLSVEVMVAYPISELPETVHDGSGFTNKYTYSSTRIDVAGGGNDDWPGYQFAIVRNGGWIDDPAIKVRATDKHGNTVLLTATWTLDVAGRPVITVVSPAPGSTIGATETLIIRATAPGGIKRCVFLARYPRGQDDDDVVHDGASWGDKFGDSSERVVIVNGFELRLKRRGGWPLGELPTIHPIAYNVVGVENV